MEKNEVMVSSPEHEETMFEYLTRLQKNIPTYTQENFLIVLHQLSYITDSYRKTFLFDNEADVLRKQNESLQSELDKQIKDNRKLVKALKQYADMSNWFVCYLRHHFIFKKDNYKANELAKETLKEVGEE